ncbi:cysteine-rich receptor-like protein kinase 2 [Sesamum indicum]|uniref:Cysteine-rich receptor-like protein kinase 2 n=1 Tax=Sesamum indicum TaxID=4182 RepID=A0A6I9SNG3_SESIN|nr:cysteine-rich receptor-like protein kinase 2 [Sesamum indicum]XP_011071119.1 cysteine-rich receptor-like protein kinase 2 [Sesamum indicum]XP_011071120.1 cysteine-rich receptor-like protein kinase 2 [Sesamum indicum]XP_020547449.1 cysteine-rich receptor-like protein kinase 2 [Sesamum indicum]
MMKKAITSPSIMIIVLVILLLPDSLFADPRAHTIKFICGTQLEHNTTIYVPNFVATMENISAQIRNSGFGIAVTGSGPDTNYGLAQCYGDLSSVDCVLCYAEARTVLPQCYPVNGGRIYLDGCFMRAENYSFFQEYTGPGDHAVCGNRTRQDSAFQASTRQALTQVVSAAPINKGYARAQVAVAGTSNQSAYVLADCWKTINANACRACLENASASILRCLPSSEGRALNTGCFMRYSDTNFLNPIPRNGNSRGRVILIVIAAVSAAAVLIIGAVIGVYLWKSRTIQKKRKGDAEKLVKTLNDSSLNFKYSTLEKATGSFDEANKLGQGGFGTVYKGVLPDGREIAVKRLFFNNRHRAADFYNEVNIISSVEHKNLVRLLGCSCSGPESLLVYEFMPNMSLDRFIFDSSKGKALNWEKRFEIIIGTAEGLVYLHENTKIRIIHRDIKASNILLDSRLRAKIADFGLARTFQEDKSHISTAIAGTLGYMAPEYLAHGQLTEKADVYSFGVLLIEIVTGRSNNRSKTTEYSDSLVTIAWTHFQQRTVEELFDPNLMLHNYHNVNIRNEILRVVHVGLLCTQEIPSLRPSMSKALRMLVKNENLPAPTSPPFTDEKTMELNDTSENFSTGLEHGNAASVASISQSIFYPR